MFSLFNVQILAFSAKNKNTRIHLAELHLDLHLIRLADYIELGPGIWWKRDGDYIEFFDGDDELDMREEGPIFLSFETHSLQDVQILLEKSWENCKTKGYDSMLKLIPGK